MKKLAFIPLFTTLVFSASYQGFESDLATTYAKGVNAILFFTSEDIISSGHYTFDNSDTTLDTHFIPFTYQFDNDSKLYNFYGTGSIGFSNYREKNINFNRGSLDTLKMQTYAIKIGGGINFHLSKDIDLMIGGAYLYSKVDGTYVTSIPLNINNPLDKTDKIIDDVINSNRSHNTYEASVSIGYHPIINMYQPYVEADMRYFKTGIDSKYTTAKDTTSTISKLKIGIITPPVTHLYDLPVTLEFYASEIFLAGDMVDVLDVEHFFVAGSTIHLGTSTMVSWIKDISFNMNIVRGKSFDGFNFGLGLSF